MAAFATADHLAGYAGLAPAPRDSGRRSGNLRRPRRYNRQLQRVFYTSALISIQRCPDSRSVLRAQTCRGQTAPSSRPRSRPPPRQRPLGHAPRPQPYLRTTHPEHLGRLTNGLRIRIRRHPREERGGRGRVGSANRWTPEPPARSADAPIGEQSRRRESGTRTTSPHFRARAEKLTKNMEVEMLIDEIRRTPAKVLSEEQRESYFENGYLLLDRIVPDDWLERLREVTAEFVEHSRALTESDAIFDLEPGHTADEPRLRRLTSPVEQHADYWACLGIGARRRRGRPGRPGREVPPLEAQLQVGDRRRGSQVAPGHPVLAAHELQPTDDGRVPL